MFFPASQHRHKVVPPVNDDHDEVTGNKSEESAHSGEMPDTGIVKDAHEPSQPRKLHGVEHHKATQQGYMALHTTSHLNTCRSMAWYGAPCPSISDFRECVQLCEDSSGDGTLF